MDLIEHLEDFSRTINVNTDGLILQIADTDEAWEKLDDACYEWEQRTGLNLAFDVIKEIYQKDVNNYLFITEDNKVEVKGTYLKEPSLLDNDLPIIKKALKDYMVDGTPVETTINSCDTLMDFQKIVKRSANYDYCWHGDDILSDKTFRVFASTRWQDGYIGKQRTKGATVEKFANTPENCFVLNANIQGVSVPPILDKQWYIDLAKKKLEDFCINV